MGTGRVLVGYRYSPPPTHPVPHYPGYTIPPATRQQCTRGQQSARVNSAVGLKSVAQLLLSAHFSGFQGITEGYPVATAGNPNDHKYILRTE